MSITLTHLIHIKKTQNGSKVMNHFAFYPFRFFRKIYFFVLARSHAPSQMVLLTSLIAHARGIKLFLCGSKEPVEKLLVLEPLHTLTTTCCSGFATQQK
ncbi:hypothetical protein KVY09_12560 (plasmid) [Staphylococcus haemolyticus]|uniref:hypothetical protein n=1 Tax=Staphylococcus haemolyticus TaxID=1283 RepID=UPI001C46A918|nr:hypothetical protein [Staphylococcus haemolyticus]QXN79041.1 hypothetical protein KVY09_12560 [Staphylococcus haemolyticus]